MQDKPRVVVGGFLGLLDAGGVAWDYIQYPLGFTQLGCDVYYIEDTGLWPVFQNDNEVGCGRNVEYLNGLMNDFGFSDRWAYVDAMSGNTYGMSLRQVREICDTADVFLNVSCSTVMRNEYAKIPVRILVDSDPMFTQIQLATEQSLTPGSGGMRELVEAHTHCFTFGERIGQPDCRIPSLGYNWKTTRQPICLSHWEVNPLANDNLGYTSVMNWSATKNLEYDGQFWGQKDIEFYKFIKVPDRLSDLSLGVAIGQTQGASFPLENISRHRWIVYRPDVVAHDWRAYRNFIQSSKGEFSVAKSTYVKARTGWFSCRSACYLASGRPVVAQDTGWSQVLPTGTGLVPFANETEAVDALLEVEANYPTHSKAAREIAEAHFDSEVVLNELLYSSSAA